MTLACCKFSHLVSYMYQTLPYPCRMQGGIHPDFTGETYLALLRAAKAAAPGIHVHAFSPLEVHQVGMSVGVGFWFISWV